MLCCVCFVRNTDKITSIDDIIHVYGDELFNDYLVITTGIVPL